MGQHPRGIFYAVGCPQTLCRYRMHERIVRNLANRERECRLLVIDLLLSRITNTIVSSETSQTRLKISRDSAGRYFRPRREHRVSDRSRRAPPGMQYLSRRVFLCMGKITIVIDTSLGKSAIARCVVRVLHITSVTLLDAHPS
jgi:hypothetical protein